MKENKETISDNQQWTTIIKPKDRLLSVDFGELWHYRDLTSLFVKRNIITQYSRPSSDRFGSSYSRPSRC